MKIVGLVFTLLHRPSPRTRRSPSDLSRGTGRPEENWRPLNRFGSRQQKRGQTRPRQRRSWFRRCRHRCLCRRRRRFCRPRCSPPRLLLPLACSPAPREQEARRRSRAWPGRKKGCTKKNNKEELSPSESRARVSSPKKLRCFLLLLLLPPSAGPETPARPHPCPARCRRQGSPAGRR